MRIFCSIDKPVSVTDYYRVRFGRVEHVSSHCRRYPRR